MTDYTELKPLLDACLAENCDGPRDFRKAVEALFDVCTVETISALIADNERLHKLVSWQGGAGNEVTISAGQLMKHMDERDQLKAENERLAAKVEQVRSRSVSLDHSPGGVIPNALDAWGRVVPQHLPYDFSGNPGANATQYCNGWNDAGGYWKAHCVDIQVERDQLRAEVAGLRTGYEAYEQVNAELKAENEALRNSSSCVDDLSALVRQLVHRLRKAAPDNDLPEKALDYLKRKGLQGSPLRNEHDDAVEREAQKIYDSWAGQDGFVPWVKGGNSLKQDEARRLTRAVMGQGERS